MGEWQRLLDGLDPQRQLPAVRETRNAVVAAGAGSGKTRVLSVRYLALVRERGLDPERIICLTFTNKAAAEMRERIHAMLAACAEDDPAFRPALASFPASRVSTLDSFCSEIARNGAPRWGIAPDFGVDETAAREATAEFTVNWLMACRSDPLAAEFLAANGFENAAEGLAALASARGGLFGAVDSGFDADAQLDGLLNLARDHHALLTDLLKGGQDLDPGTAAGGKAWIEAAARFPDWPDDIHDPAGLRALGDACAAVAGLRKPSGKSPAAGYYNGVTDQVRSYADIVRLAAAVLTGGRQEQALAFIRGYIRDAADARAASGMLGFSDVAYLALATLRDDLTLRHWYASRFDAIMIDEFQDNNVLQKDLLYLLAGDPRANPRAGVVPGPEGLRPGVLFFVGDEKQSIYAFRQADVRVFRGLEDELSRAPGGLGRHDLSVNWRSEPGLIDFFNTTFAAVFPPSGADARDYEARFEGLLAGPPTFGVEAVARYLEIQPAGGNDGYLGADETQARRIAVLIGELVDGGVPVAGKDGSGKNALPCRHEDIAILFRSSASQNVVERHLRLAGIPYTAVSTAGLYAESILGDLYSVLRLSAYPHDRHALACALRGPFARLSDEGTVAVLESGGLEATGAALTADDGSRLGALGATLSGIAERADRDSLAGMVAWLWYERGLRWNVLREPANAAFLDHFDYAWALAAAADRRGLRLADFVSELEERMGTVEKLVDVAVPRPGARGVNLMTVHASKGLEFPVVILPSLENSGRNDTQAPVNRGRRLGWSLRLVDDAGYSSNPLADLEKKLEALEKTGGQKVMTERLAETARLFYVACTRATSRLYLFGKAPSREDKDGNSFRGLLLRAWPNLAAATDKEPIPAWTRPKGGILDRDLVPPLSLKDYAAIKPAARDSGVRRARAVADAPVIQMPERRARLAVTEAAALVHAGLPWQDGAPLAAETEIPGTPSLTDAQFGTLCHLWVQAAIQRSGARPVLPPDLAAAVGRLPAASRAALEKEAETLASNFLATDLGQAALRAARHPDAGALASAPVVFAVEYPFVYRAPGPVYLSGSMDLVFGDASGVTVVDFKTDRHEDPAAHRFQLSVYRESAQDIFGRPASALVYYLRSGTAVPVEGPPDMGALSSSLARTRTL